MIDIKRLVRPNILRLEPYSSAREEYHGHAGVLLDANENPYESGHNRYPDPRQKVLKEKIAELKEVSPEKIFLGNGSDEVIDLLIRAFCEPRVDNIICMDPSYGMYRVSADIHEVKVTDVPLSEDFELEAWPVLRSASEQTKVIFLCSPNNPSGNDLDHVEILKVVRKFGGLVVVDEAYVDFSKDRSLLEYIAKYKNLIILQTFSKAWGMAGIRLGMAFADEEVIQVLNKVKPPYNISDLTQEAAMKALQNKERKEVWVADILEERGKLKEHLGGLDIVQHVYPSDANFLLVRFRDSQQVFDHLVQNKIILRNRHKALLCEDCLRITIGTPEENRALLEALASYPSSVTVH